MPTHEEIPQVLSIHGDHSRTLWTGAFEAVAVLLKHQGGFEFGVRVSVCFHTSPAVVLSFCVFGSSVPPPVYFPDSLLQ